LLTLEIDLDPSPQIPIARVGMPPAQLRPRYKVIAAPRKECVHGHQERATKVCELVSDALPARVVIVKHSLDHTVVLKKSKILAKHLRLQAVDRPQDLEVPTWPIKQL
jgi:hypothetical protein